MPWSHSPFWLTFLRIADISCPYSPTNFPSTHQYMSLQHSELSGFYIQTKFGFQTLPRLASTLWTVYLSHTDQWIGLCRPFLFLSLLQSHLHDCGSWKQLQTSSESSSSTFLFLQQELLKFYTTDYRYHQFCYHTDDAAIIYQEHPESFSYYTVTKSNFCPFLRGYKCTLQLTQFISLRHISRSLISGHC